MATLKPAPPPPPLEIRREEISLMVGRVSGMASQRGLKARERIGICYVQEMLEGRIEELDEAIARRERKEAPDGD